MNKTTELPATPEELNSYLEALWMVRPEITRTAFEPLPLVIPLPFEPHK